MPDINRIIESTERQAADIRGRQFEPEEGLPEPAVRLVEMSALRWRWNSLKDLYEKGRKALDKEISTLVGVGEKYEVGGLSVNNVETSYFDVPAWRSTLNSPKSTPAEREALAAWNTYKAAEDAARATESIKKSGGLKICPAKERENEQ
jgi:hypothetical protein